MQRFASFGRNQVLRRVMSSSGRKPLTPSSVLRDVKYELRGPLAERALAKERAGTPVLKCNVGNPGAFGFGVPQAIRDAYVSGWEESIPYVHQKGLVEAREEIVRHYQGRNHPDAKYARDPDPMLLSALVIPYAPITTDDIWIGNGVSELIMMSMRCLLEPGDEVLIPSPDYPLWTASVRIHGATAVHYDCLPSNAFFPEIEDIRSKLTEKTRAIVLINPNNPTGAVYPAEIVQQIVEIAENAPQGPIPIFSDEIYDQLTFPESPGHTPTANFVSKSMCVTFGGLSKVWRACGWRTGWAVHSGNRDDAAAYYAELDKMAALRLCSNAPGQTTIHAALTQENEAKALVSDGGRLNEARRAVVETVAESKYMRVHAPQGAMYAFVEVLFDNFDDVQFALDLVDRKSILVVPGSGFNVPYRNHFRITLLPQPDDLRKAFVSINELLEEYAAERGL